MGRATKILRRCRQAFEDLELRRLLQSEINHELSSPLPGNQSGGGSLGEFVVDWDSSNSQDVLLRRYCHSGEEVAVSAMLGPSRQDGLIKVCVKKSSFNSVLHFDCGFYANSQFDIYNVSFLHSTACPNPSTYRGPCFRTLDPDLQTALKEYLVAKGISESLMNFLLQHLTKKEQGQYVNWLQKLESLITESK